MIPIPVKNQISILISSLLNEYKNKKSIFLFKKDTSGLPYSSLIKTRIIFTKTSILNQFQIKLKMFINFQNILKCNKSPQY